MTIKAGDDLDSRQPQNETGSKRRLTPSDKVVELERRRGVKDVGDNPGVKIDSLDEHPEDGGHVAVEEQDEDELADVTLQRKKRKNGWMGIKKLISNLVKNFNDFFFFIKFPDAIKEYSSTSSEG